MNTMQNVSPAGDKIVSLLYATVRSFIPLVLVFNKEIFLCLQQITAVLDTWLQNNYKVVYNHFNPELTLLTKAPRSESSFCLF